MEVWLIKEGENLPIVQGDRIGRVGSLAQYLSEKGDYVVWWASTFRHANKSYLYDQYTEINISDHYKLCLLHSKICYKKNMSLRRVFYHNQLARQLKMKIKNVNRPDIILCSYPSEPLCRVMIQYGKDNHIPVIIDARDQWPDIFERAFPKRFKKVANVLLRPMKKRAAYVFQNADALCAMSPIMLGWALNYANRKKNDLDQYIFIGNKREEFTSTEMEFALKNWENIGISDKTWNVCLFSSLSKTSLDMDTLIDAIKSVHEVYPQTHLIIGGKGDDEARLLEYTSGLDYIHMMGWMNQIQMASIMNISKVGMLNYRNTRDFKDGWGNKVGQYLSYGLPILTSATGFAKTYLEQYGCGVYYEENNVQNLADVLMRLIEHPEEQAELSAKANSRFQMDFEQSVVMKQFKKMIDDVCRQYQLSAK